MIYRRTPPLAFLARFTTATIVFCVALAAPVFGADMAGDTVTGEAIQSEGAAATKKPQAQLDPNDPGDALVKAHTDGFFALAQRFDAPLGLRGYLLTSPTTQPVVIYTDPLGSHLFVGAVINADGDNVATPYLSVYLERQMLPALFERLEELGGYVEEGPENEPLIYVMFDPRCAHCADLYGKLRSYVADGALRVRWVPVDVLGDEPMAAVVLDAKAAGKGLSTIASFFAPESDNAESVRSTSAMEPSAASRTAASANGEILALLGLSGTPQILFRARSGSYQIVRGAPSKEELELVIDSAAAAVIDPSDNEENPHEDARQ